MRHIRATLLICASAALFPAGLFSQAISQTSASINSGPNGFGGTASFAAPLRFTARAVTNAPYSGEEVTEQVRTLADGTHITQDSPARKVYRDSLGRTRMERPLFGGMAMAGRVPESPTIVEITDPVAQVKYTLDTINKVAHRQQLPAPPELPAARNAASVRSGTLGGAIAAPGAAMAGGGGARVAAPPDNARPQMTSEKLGTQTIEGVLAEGTRTTTTWAIGAQGNDRPITVVSEMWMSPVLKVMILNKSTDPRNGDHTQKLTNISQSEPPAYLFQPPPEYSVVDETGAFTIKWGSQ